VIFLQRTFTSLVHAHAGRTQEFSRRTNYSWLFVRASLILANCNLPLKMALCSSRSCQLTLIEVLDSAVKIGLGAVITVYAGFLTLKKTHSFESLKRKEEFFYKKQDERKSAYVDFSILSHSLIQQFEFGWCDSSGDDYKEYIVAFNNVQIISPDLVRKTVGETFNAVTTFICLNKMNQSNDENMSNMHKGLKTEAQFKIATFQSIAQQDVTRVYS
jgi:hypothetical protein